MVKLIINADNCPNDKTTYYEFIFRGSMEGTHFTLNELKNKFDYECTLPPNSGNHQSIADEDFEDFLSNNAKAKFFS